jgi:hypothetical protein
MFNNRVLRRLFGSKRKEVTGGWSNFHNEDDFWSLPNINKGPK